MKFEFMKNNVHKFSIEKMAIVLGVSRSGYYEYMSRKPGKRELENQILQREIEKVHQKSRCAYGSPRIHVEIKKKGYSCSRKRVAKLMKQAAIQAKMRKKWKGSHEKREQPAVIAPNHLAQNFIVEEPNKVWASDITYVATQEGWLYVAVVMDLFSRKIIGLSLGTSLKTELVIQAIQQALLRRTPVKGVMHHSDRGCQYTSKEFKEMAIRHGIQLSMSAKGHCYDNAVVESFFHTLKTEETHLSSYKMREEAKLSIFEYIEGFYNRQRLHSTLGYQSPEEFEKIWEASRSEEVVLA